MFLNVFGLFNEKKLKSEKEKKLGYTNLWTNERDGGGTFFFPFQDLKLEVFTVASFEERITFFKPLEGTSVHTTVGVGQGAKLQGLRKVSLTFL